LFRIGNTQTRKVDAILTSYAMLPKTGKNFAHRLCSALRDIFQSLTQALFRIGQCCKVEQPLISRHFLNNNLCLAIYRQGHRLVCGLHTFDELGRIFMELCKGLAIESRVDHDCLHCA
jgi:hypothetical protein